MGAFSLERSVRYLSVKTRRAWRSFKREYRPTLRTTTRLARNGVIFAATAAGLGAAYDYIAHANGENGLTRGYVWGAVSNDNGCVTAGFLASNPREPGVSLHMRPFVGDDVQQDVGFDLSGSPLGAGVQEFCFNEGELAHAGVIFWAENNGVRGNEEMYSFQNP